MLRISSGEFTFVGRLEDEEAPILVRCLWQGVQQIAFTES